MNKMDMEPRYNPQIFNQMTFDEAKNIILTPEVGLTTNERWEHETAWLSEHIKFPSTEILLIDYGCGIGRISKILENPVIGVDISPTMRQMAPLYVNRAAFTISHPPMLRVMVSNGLRASGAVAIWALQHVFDLGYDTQILADILVPGSILWTLDQSRRYVPSTFQTDDSSQPTFTWVDDGQSVVDYLTDARFELEDETIPPLSLCHPGAKLRQWVRL